MNALAGRLAKLESEYEGLITRRAGKDGPRTDLLGGRTASVNKVRSSLSPDEALIEYLVMPDRVLMFDDGRIVEEGPPEQVLKAPTHPRTRQFLRAVLER